MELAARAARQFIVIADIGAERIIETRVHFALKRRHFLGRQLARDDKPDFDSDPLPAANLNLLHHGEIDQKILKAGIELLPIGQRDGGAGPGLRGRRHCAGRW